MLMDPVITHAWKSPVVTYSRSELTQKSSSDVGWRFFVGTVYMCHVVTLKCWYPVDGERWKGERNEGECRKLFLWMNWACHIIASYVRYFCKRNYVSMRRRNTNFNDPCARFASQMKASEQAWECVWGMCVLRHGKCLSAWNLIGKLGLVGNIRLPFVAEGFDIITERRLGADSLLKSWWVLNRSRNSAYFI